MIEVQLKNGNVAQVKADEAKWEAVQLSQGLLPMLKLTLYYASAKVGEFSESEVIGWHIS